MGHIIPYPHVIARPFHLSYLFLKALDCLATYLCQETRRHEVIKSRGNIETNGNKRGATKFGQLAHDVVMLRLFGLLEFKTFFLGYDATSSSLNR